MAFSPIDCSKDITEKYKRYLKTIFRIDDPEYQAQLDREMDQENFLAKGPYLDVVDAFQKGSTLEQLVEEGVVPEAMRKLNFPMERPLHRHQENALRKSLQGRNIVVSTGTGSGKTESFLLPILAHLAKEEEEGTLCPGVRALLIYPMNALANDQVERLRELLVHYPKITFGSYTGQTKNKQDEALREYKALNHNQDPIPNERISREEMLEKPPHILITNYAMLEYLMVRPRENVFFNGSYARFWKFIVLDEAHVYRGSTGIEVSMLLRRVRSCLPVSGLQYILTSATLGSDDQNAEVAAFAQNLCAASFRAEDVIRAARVNPKGEERNHTRYPSYIYEKLADAIRTEDNVRIAKALSDVCGMNCSASDDLKDIVYQYVLGDETYWQVRAELKDAPRTVRYLADRLGCSEREVENFVTVAGFAVHEGGQLFDAKYHMFIRAIDSAFITLAPAKRLMLTRRKAQMVNGKEYCAFEISVCDSCHAIYLAGECNEEQHLVQSKRNREAFYLGDSLKDASLIKSGNIEEYRLCPYCGKLMLPGASAMQRCEHDPSDYVTVYRLHESVQGVKRCVACMNRNNAGILHSFFTGQEAVTSVLGTALFENLPSKKTVSVDIEDSDEFEDEFEDEAESSGTIEITKENAAKQFIAFSDNRQAAAFFATYFEDTYTNILYKRLIVETIKREHFNGPVQMFADSLQGSFEQYNILDENQSSQKEAWKAILAEMVDGYSQRSLQNMGFFRFTVDQTSSSSKRGLNKDELTDVLNVILKTMMSDAAIDYPVTLNAQEKEYFSFNGHEGRFSLSDASTYGVSSFLSSKVSAVNAREDYVYRVLKSTNPEITMEDTRKYLRMIWDHLLIKGAFITAHGGLYKVNAAKIRIETGVRFYRCSKCRRITPYNVHNVCPAYKCDGRLEEVNLPEILRDNHYYNIYQNMEIRKMRVVEHTAQLDREKAYDYQQKFKEKKIDVLSCSTTFELGVDVGSLETVFMRNMPPSPANYAQRAGRAGRSVQSVAYALTFCNRGSHDFSYFNSPETMIRGRIDPPVFDVSNDRIGIRHVYSSAFAFFWRKYREYYKDIATFVEEANGTSGLQLFKEYLHTQPSNLREFLQDFLPADLADEYGVSGYKWTEDLIGEEGILTKAVEVYKYDLDVITRAYQKALESDKKVDYLRMRINTYRQEQILTFLSRKNVLPKYGFPVDTVELQIPYSDSNGKNNKLDLQLTRNLEIAISEYAPGSQIVADGNLIESRYIKRIPNMAWKMYDYVQCKNCKTLNINTHTDAADNLAVCKGCGEPLDKMRIRTFIIPEFGFEAGRISKATLMKPRRLYSNETAYVGFLDAIKEKTFGEGNRHYGLLYSQNDELAVLNDTYFYVCPECGYTATSLKGISGRSTAQQKHSTSSGYPCGNNVLNNYALGYRFKTDVIQLRFYWPHIHAYDQAVSILYGIIRGMCTYLNIEQSDVAGCLQYFENEYTGTGDYGLIIYDNTPGGAGYVKRLDSEEVMEGVLRKTYDIMNSCTCGGDKKDTSCYNCLRNYGNQRYHDILQRRYVIDFLNKMFDGKLDDPAGYRNNPNGWEVIMERIEYAAPETVSYAKYARSQGMKAPSAVDLVLRDDFGGGSKVALAWEKQKTGFLDDAHKMHADDLRAEGWTIMTSESIPKASR